MLAASTGTEKGPIHTSLFIILLVHRILLLTFDFCLQQVSEALIMKP